MEQPATCGQGIAEQARLPLKLGELMARIASILEFHMTALDANDPAAEQERAVYEEVARRHRRIASELKSTADEMARARDLPMGGHDPNVMTSLEATDVFADYVRVQNELLSLLSEQSDRNATMLAEMRGG